MVSAPPETIRWNSFLKREHDVDGQLVVPVPVKKAIDAFRRQEWPLIQREYDAKHSDIPLWIEPCWSEPGKAVYWQEQFKGVGVLAKDQQGTERRPRIVHESIGWEATNPLPAYNADVIAAYLRKGLRLRPPSDTGYSEMSELPPLAGGSQGEPEPKYTCDRHPSGKRGFPTWKGYLQHCAQFKESLENVPEEVVEKAKEFLYYCALHDRGFRHKAHAARHMKTELRRPGRPQHPTVQQMEVHLGV